MATLEDAQAWIEFSNEQIARKKGFIAAGSVKQSRYTSIGDLYSDLAKSRFLHNDPIEEVRAAYREAAQTMEISFIMAYDATSPRYLGDKADYSDVLELHGIEMLIWALCATDLELARKLAHWPRVPPDGEEMDMEVRNFAYALQHFLLGDTEKSDALLSEIFAKYRSPPKSGFQQNYYTLAWALAGIVRGDERLLNDGLAHQLKSYKGYARGEAADTPEQYICDNAVGLANLAILSGLKVTAQGDYLPKGILATPA